MMGAVGRLLGGRGRVHQLEGELREAVAMVGDAHDEVARIADGLDSLVVHPDYRETHLELLLSLRYLAGQCWGFSCTPDEYEDWTESNTPTREPCEGRQRLGARVPVGRRNTE